MGGRETEYLDVAVSLLKEMLIVAFHSKPQSCWSQLCVVRVAWSSPHTLLLYTLVGSIYSYLPTCACVGVSPPPPLPLTHSHSHSSSPPHPLTHSPSPSQLGNVKRATQYTRDLLQNGKQVTIATCTGMSCSIGPVNMERYLFLLMYVWVLIITCFSLQLP